MYTDSIDDLPQSLHRAAGVRELDRIAIEDAGIPGFTLMRRAGRAAFRLLQASWPEAGRIAVLCGSGNNGGDGCIVAAEAARRGLEVELYLMAPRERLRGAAAAALDAALEAGVTPRPWQGGPLQADVVVDALLGTGLSGAVRADYRQAIEAINRSAAPVLAIDIPSGLCSDTGTVLGAAVTAARTLSFIGMKLGLLTGDGRSCAGRVHFDDLQVPGAVLAQVAAVCRRLDGGDLGAALPPRPRSAHKGSYGHVLVAGGDHGMGGAGVLAALAAARCGAGLVSLASRPGHVAAAMARAPEVMSHAVSSGQELQPLLARPTTLVVGPGLGRAPWGEQLLFHARESGKPLVVDADGLNLLAAAGLQRPEGAGPWVLTPHPGEAARLLGASVAEVQRDRLAAVRELSRRSGATVVLKGSGTLIDDGSGTPALCPYGNPGMATGGMGDVLSGVIGALLAQGHAPLRAAELGVLLHALAADRAAAEGERGMLAGDLLPWLRRLVNPGAAADAPGLDG